MASKMQDPITVEQNITPAQPRKSQGFWHLVGYYLPMALAAFIAIVLLILYFTLNLAEINTREYLQLIPEEKLNQIINSSGHYSFLMFLATMASLNLLIANLKDPALKDIAHASAGRSFIWYSISFAILAACLAISSLLVWIFESNGVLLWIWAWSLLSASASGLLWFMSSMFLTFKSGSALQE